MASDLSTALEHEHRQIDAGIEAFASGWDTDPSEQQLAAVNHALPLLRRHIYVEEVYLFPSLRQAGLLAPVLVMLREHGQMWSTLNAVEQALTRAAPGDGALAVCDELTAQLEAHNLKEERILYPQADNLLPEAIGNELAEFIASGQLPAGWVCEGARTEQQ